MRILAIDTSQPRGSASILTDGPSETVHFGDDSSHLIELSKAVAGLLEKADTDIANIDRVAYVSGPGSFTGLRIGLSYVKGLYAALEMDVVSMSSLELLALDAIKSCERVCVMIDARRDEVYAAAFSNGGASDVPQVRTTIAPTAMGPEKFLGSLENAATLFVGSGAARYRSIVESHFGKMASFVDARCNAPSTALLCRVAPSLPPRAPEDILLLEPFYIRPSDAKLKPLREIRVHD